MSTTEEVMRSALAQIRDLPQFDEKTGAYAVGIAIDTLAALGCLTTANPSPPAGNPEPAVPAAKVIALAAGYERCAAADDAQANHFCQGAEPHTKARTRADMNRRHAADLRALASQTTGGRHG